MATLQQLEEGIRRAHAAGNTEHVRALGQAYRQMQMETQAAPVEASSSPPTGAKPGTRKYADWAAQRARAGAELPQVSDLGATGTESSILDPFVQGTTFGFADELRGAVQGGIAAVQGGDFGRTYENVVDESRQSLEQERRVNPIGAVAAEIAGAIPTSMVAGGQLAGRGATALGRSLSGGAVGFGQGVAYGVGASDADTAQGRVVDGAWSGLLGGGIGAAAPAIGQAARRLVSPNPASASQTAAAKALANEGVTLTAGQRTGSKGLQYMESELGGQRAADLMEQQAEQFTAAALKRAGIAATRATPDVIDGAFTNLGAQFDSIAALTDTPFDATLQNNLLSVVSDYLDVAANPAPVVERLLNRVSEIAQQSGGRLTGQPYQNLRSELGRLMKSADGPTKQALSDMQEALDDAIQRNMSGKTLEVWKNLRRQYKNLLVLERASTGAGANTAAGLLSPAQLRGAAINQNRRAFARGTNDFTELANAGVQVMTPLPQSGTAPRLAARSLTNLPGMIGAVAGTPGGLPGMVAGGLAGAALPAVVGRAITSRPGMALLANQRAVGPGAGAVERLVRRSGTPLIGQR